MPENTTNKTRPSVEIFFDNYAFRDRGLIKLIAQKAYELYLQRGQVDGHDVQDWLEAEKLVLAGIGSMNFMEQWLQNLTGLNDGEKSNHHSTF